MAPILCLAYTIDFTSLPLCAYHFRLLMEIHLRKFCGKQELTLFKIFEKELSMTHPLPLCSKHNSGNFSQNINIDIVICQM